MDSLDPAGGVFITAEGLLILPQRTTHQGCLNNQTFLAINALRPAAAGAGWSRLGLRTSLRYEVPRVPFSMSVAQAADLVNKGAWCRRGPRSRRKMPPGRDLWSYGAVDRLPPAVFDPLRPCLTCRVWSSRKMGEMAHHADFVSCPALAPPTTIRLCSVSRLGSKREMSAKRPPRF